MLAASAIRCMSNDRFLRMLVFFDLPTETKQDRREYARFRKFLIKNGFLMMQESVYCKLLLHATAQQLLLAQLHKNKPPAGLVQILTVTERQFVRIEYLVGEYHGDAVISDERLLEF